MSVSYSNFDETQMCLNRKFELNHELLNRFIEGFDFKIDFGLVVKDKYNLYRRRKYKLFDYLLPSRTIYTIRNDGIDKIYVWVYGSMGDYQRMLNHAYNFSHENKLIDISVYHMELKPLDFVM